LIVNVAALDFLKGDHDVAVDVDRRYTRPQLSALLQRAGFRVNRLTYWNMSLLPIIAAKRWQSRRRPMAKAKSDFASLPTIVNAFLTNLVRLELRLSSVVPLPLGSSLLGHAVKP
jgi:hypothetical protein